VGTVRHPERWADANQDVVPLLRSRAVRQAAAATPVAEPAVAVAARIHPVTRLATAGALVPFRSGWEW
jgi:hypothetical protein